MNIEPETVSLLDRIRAWVPSPRTLQYAGLVLQVSSFVFLGLVLHKHFDRLRASNIELSDLSQALGLLLLVSLGMVITLVIGWRELLIGAGAKAASIRSALWIIGRTAIAKYVPGNVFQYVGRQFFADTLGATQREVFASTLGEILVVASLSCMFAALSLPFADIPASVEAFRAPAVAVIALGACSPLIAWRVGPFLARRGPFKFLRPMFEIDFVSWLRAYLAYAACFALGLAAFLVAAMYFIGDFSDVELLTLTAAYSISYAFGFMMPGAPGGLGVREALIVIIAGTHFDPAALAAAALVQRVANVLAESICFAGSFVLSRSAPSAPQANASG